MFEISKKDSTVANDNKEQQIRSLTQQLNDYQSRNAVLQNVINSLDNDGAKSSAYIQVMENKMNEFMSEKIRLLNANAGLQGKIDVLQADLSKLVVKCLGFTSDIYPLVCGSNFQQLNCSPNTSSSPHSGQMHMSPSPSMSQLSCQMHRLSPGIDHFYHPSSAREIVLRTSVGSSGIGQNFGTPQGFTLGMNKEIAVADTNNNRCIVFDTDGKYLKELGRGGVDEGHLNYPRKIISVMRNSECHYIILDRGPSQLFNRLQMFDSKGHFLYRLISTPFASAEQINLLAVNKDNEQLVIYDNKNNILAMDLNQLPRIRAVQAFNVSKTVQEAMDMAVANGFYYITDYKAHCVVVHSLEGEFVQKFGSITLTPYPIGVDISSNGDIMVADSHGNHFHVVIFNNKGDYQQDYKCLGQKISRCLGLKITEDGFLVSLSRQSNCLLVFNPLFSPVDANLECAAV